MQRADTARVGVGSAPVLPITLKVSIPSKKWPPASLSYPPVLTQEAPPGSPRSCPPSSHHHPVIQRTSTSPSNPPRSQTDQNWEREVGPQGLCLPKAEKLRLGNPLVPSPQPTSFSISFSLKYSVSGLKSFDCFHCLMGGGGQ